MRRKYETASNMESDLDLSQVLPQTVVLKHKKYERYLRYTDEDDEQHGLLQFTEEQPTNPKSRFQLEPSNTAKGLVHIRCVYNNKYLARSAPDQFWISAAAARPEDDRSKWTCTLFKPVVDEDMAAAISARFLHVQLNRYACPFRDGGRYDNFLYAGREEPQANLMDVCEVVDWESLLVLPRNVAFKGDNGLYLRVVPLMQIVLSAFQFSSDDIGDPNAGFQVFPTTEGAVRIKSNSTHMFWRWMNTKEPNWIGLGLESHPDTLFWPVKVDDNTIALRSNTNNKYCRRQTVMNLPDAMAASVSTISHEARIQVEELVISRQIYNVEFRLQDARIYGRTIVVAATGDSTNDGPNVVTNTLTA